jgi:hypothetical protein
MSWVRIHALTHTYTHTHTHTPSRAPQDMKPKHLFSGKRGIGKTDRR